MPTKKEPPEDEAKEVKTVHSYRSDHTLIIVGIVAAVVFIFLLGIGIGSWRHRNVVSFRSVSVMGGGAGPHASDGHFMVQNQNFIGSGSNSADRVNGVVTAVNGSDFSVAGYGSTTNVTTNSSTQYQDGNAVKVDDTVTVFGTTSNGTLTATSIAINP